MHRAILFLSMLVACPVASPAQIPDDAAYDVDVVLLNQKLRELAARNLIKKWSLSKNGEVLKVEVTEQWALMPRQQKAEFARRVLSLFGYYIDSRDARNWKFSVILEKDGGTVAEDRAEWWQADKNPQVRE